MALSWALFQPTRKTQRVLQLRERAPHANEHLLREIVGERSVTRESAHQVPHPRLPPPHELLERSPIAAPREMHDERLGRDRIRRAWRHFD